MVGKAFSKIIMTTIRVQNDTFRQKLSTFSDSLMLVVCSTGKALQNRCFHLAKADESLCQSFSIEIVWYASRFVVANRTPRMMNASALIYRQLPFDDHLRELRLIGHLQLVFELLRQDYRGQCMGLHLIDQPLVDTSQRRSSDITCNQCTTLDTWCPLLVIFSAWEHIHVLVL